MISVPLFERDESPERLALPCPPGPWLEDPGRRGTASPGKDRGSHSLPGHGAASRQLASGSARGLDVHRDTCRNRNYARGLACHGISKEIFKPKFYVYCPKSCASSDQFWLFQNFSAPFPHPPSLISRVFMEKILRLVHTSGG